MTLLYSFVIFVCIGVVIFSALASNRRSELYREIQQEINARERLIMDLQAGSAHQNRVVREVYEAGDIETSYQMNEQLVRVKSVHQWVRSSFLEKDVAKWVDPASLIKEASLAKEDDYFKYLNDVTFARGTNTIQ